MNRRDLAKSVAVQADVDLKTTTTVLDSLIDVVTAVVSKGEPVAVTGFAKFVKVDRPARMGRNPATGEAIMIKASKKARITPVKAFKDAVMAPASAPKLARGVFPVSADAVRTAGKRAEPPRPAKAVAKAKKTSAKKKSTARRAPAKKKSTARRAPAKKKSTARRAPARRAPARRPARKTAARRR